MKLFPFVAALLLSTTSTFSDHGVSAWGKLKYSEGFKHFDYVNPEAPTGGELVIGVLGSYSSLNMFIVMGDPAAGLGLAHATLLEPAYDTISESYGYVAKDVDVSSDQKMVTFTLRDDATFTDGSKITPDDIVFSFNILLKKGLPLFRTYYGDVDHVEVLEGNKVRFHLKTAKFRELPIILGQIPALSKKYYEKKDFGKPSLDIPPLSGGYDIEKVSPGQSITYVRRKDWWGKHIPSHVGMMNFERIQYVYYKDNNALFAGFTSGQVNIRVESTAKLWATAYNFPAVKEGKVKLDSIKHEMCSGTYGLFFNTRREIFKNRTVRKALSRLYDFVWSNKNIFYGNYVRNETYFPNSQLASKGSITKEEQAFIDRSKIKLSEDVLNEFHLPEFKNEEEKRKVIQESLDLLKEAGWVLKNQKLENAKGQQFTFTIYVYDPTFERVFSNYIETLKSIGINVKVREIDPSSYEEKIQNLDFDVVTSALPQSNSPGSELRDYFGSTSANQKGTRNFSGIQSKEIDTLIEDIIDSYTLDDLSHGIRALDRVLLDGYYMMPAWHSNVLHVAYWDEFARPKTAPKYNPLPVETWWFKNAEKTEISDNVHHTLWSRIKSFLRGLFIK